MPEFKVGKSSHAWTKEPRQLGLRAGQLFLLPSSCPFPDGTSDADKWERGWRDGSERALAKTGRPHRG
jgi:hypothetical protein